jgi:2-polyprenyl-3-methyl-5-hydroxy-6-metoxy-1,4-benzoquinol methylase
MTNPRDDTRRLAAEFAEKGDPDGWFEEFYARAGGDVEKVYWADREPGPHLVAYLEQHPAPEGARAVTIGCGLGDDAEALAASGHEVTAFDISPAAIDMCRQRFPDSTVDYRVADLFDLPAAWRRSYDLVYECNTIQILTGANRTAARDAMADLVKPGGVILVSCRSRNQGEGLDAWPLALDRAEIDGFVRAGLTEMLFEAYDDEQDPPVPHFFAVYRR